MYSFAYHQNEPHRYYSHLHLAVAITAASAEAQASVENSMPATTPPLPTKLSILFYKFIFFPFVYVMHCFDYYIQTISHSLVYQLNIFHHDARRAVSIVILVSSRPAKTEYKKKIN